MDDKKLYDIIGIGIGPFNLGLAALAHDLPELRCLFLDSKKEFTWHPGMLIPGTRMQVPFYADLVTLADPCSRFSYFSFLKAKERMIRFGVLDNNYPLRTEYNEYCQWVASQLPALRFGHTCQEIRYQEDQQCYEIITSSKKGNSSSYWSKHVVIGVGTVPSLPVGTNGVDHPMVFHSAGYLFKKTELLRQSRITLVGSGQSAAEIFNDLLQHADKLDSLCWITRSERISPMDFSKFSLELSSPAYIDHFYRMTDSNKKQVLAGQENLYKHINIDTITATYEKLHLLEQAGLDGRIKILPGTVLQQVDSLPDSKLHLQLFHKTTERNVGHISDALILATGYGYQVPKFLSPVYDWIEWAKDGWYKVKQNYSIDKGSTLFVQNADLYTHGFNSADLGMGPYRNAVILNTILGRPHFTIEKGSPFQSFNPF